MKPHLQSLRLRSYSDVNASNVLHHPCSGLISYNSFLKIAPASRLPPCCQSKTSKIQICIHQSPVTLFLVDCWYPHEMGGFLTVTFKALYGLTRAAVSLTLSPGTLHTSNTGCIRSVPYHTHSHCGAFAHDVPLHLEDSSFLLPPPPHQFLSTCYSLIRSQLLCHFSRKHHWALQV